MPFSDILESKQKVKDLILYLPTDEQQEFYELGQIVEKLVERHLQEIGLNGLTQKDEDNKKRFIFLLNKAKKLSKMKLEERLIILSLSDQDQDKYFELSSIFKDIMNGEYKGDIPENDLIIKKYERLYDTAKSMYDHRSIL